jgi:ABC-type transport system involved in cytochrome bd biosynthesis fused ATPase/permease subunit
MEERMPMAPGPMEDGDSSDPLADPRAAQVLATEHWSLLATRSMSWNEAFSRTSTFLSTLSAATVALALAGPAMAFGSAFALFAMIVLSVTLFLGVATFIRLTQVNNEDLHWVMGMNLLRGAYADLVPGIEAWFVAGHGMDPRSIARTFGATDVEKPSILHFFVTSPAIVGVISSVIAGVMGGIISIQLGWDVVVAVIVGLAIFGLATASLIAYAGREYRAQVERLTELRSEIVAGRAGHPSPARDRG